MSAGAAERGEKRMETYPLERTAEAIASVRCGACMSEEELHALIARALVGAGIEVQHEVRLAPRCRIDFMAGTVGIEIKKSRPQRAALTAQLTRYAACDQVEALLVIAPRGVNLPRTIGGKRVVMIALERLWGVSLP